MVLESGLLYPLALIICLIFIVSNSIIVEPLLTVIVGIAPTMIIVRVDLGISVEAPPSTSSNPTSQSVSDLETQPLAYSHPCDLEIPWPLPLPQLHAKPDQTGFTTSSRKGEGNLRDVSARE
ncbi:hypothetical protein GYMLUDRAFT_911233 [Collybiopsis luxurians FD-317 M1]|nr:hypothetical protein GYMLUDRAFT_911233 [Collybiopsis luxurians FD-317 M1]